MMSFKSRNYPRSLQKFSLQQEYALRFYAIFFGIVLFIVMGLMQAGKDILWAGIIGAAVSIFLANFSAVQLLRRKVAEIFFVEDSFSVISVYDILYKLPGKSFPLRLANAVRMGDEIQFHYLDNVMTIRREDFDEFDLLWTWMNPPPAAQPGIQYFYREQQDHSEAEPG